MTTIASRLRSLLLLPLLLALAGTAPACRPAQAGTTIKRSPASGGGGGTCAACSLGWFQTERTFAQTAGMDWDKQVEFVDAAEFVATASGATTVGATTVVDGGGYVVTNAAGTDNFAIGRIGSTSLAFTPATITNPKARPWMVSALFSFFSGAVDATTTFAINLTDNAAGQISCFYGIVGAQSTVNLRGVMGATVTTTTQAFATDTSIHSLRMFFDGSTTIHYYYDGNEVGTQTDLTNQTTAPRTGSIYVRNGVTAAAHSWIVRGFYQAGQRI